MDSLITSHGSDLKNNNSFSFPTLLSDFGLKRLPVWTLTPRQRCDIELILNGGFSPLTGFVSQQDYEAILNVMRLTTGLLWPMPITLDVNLAFAETVQIGEQILLKDTDSTPIALLTINDIWQPDKVFEAKAVFGTEDMIHPGVNYLINNSGPVYIGGQLHGINLPKHYDYTHLRHTPTELRTHFANSNWHKIVAFQTRNPLHRAHYELTLRAATLWEAKLLIHPVVGVTKLGDIDYHTRVRCYQKILSHYPKDIALLSLLPLAMRMAGPREALWHAIIRKNYGCTHFIVGRDHAGPGKDKTGNDFYEPYAAQVLLKDHEAELGIKILPFQEMVYVAGKKIYLPVNEVHEGKSMSISGTELRNRLQRGEEIPKWFSYPEVIAELRLSYPPKNKQGFAIFFTGLSGAGKSTLATILLSKFLELNRKVTLLDGDEVRKTLSSELGFSKAHRDLNILRIGYVASEIVKHGGIAICAPIAPYTASRQKVRELITQHGGFIEVYLSTPLSVCEQRDVKGLYSQVRQGLIHNFTGIDDPYETPINPELNIDTAQCTPEEAVGEILATLHLQGFFNAIQHDNTNTK